MRRHTSVHTWSFGGEHREDAAAAAAGRRPCCIATVPLLRPSMVVLGEEDIRRPDHHHARFPAREQDMLERCMDCDEFGPQFVEVARQIFFSLFQTSSSPATTTSGPASARNEEELAFIRCAFWTQLLLYDADSVLFPC